VPLHGQTNGQTWSNIVRQLELVLSLLWMCSVAIGERCMSLLQPHPASPAHGKLLWKDICSCVHATRFFWVFLLMMNVCLQSLLMPAVNMATVCPDWLAAASRICLLLHAKCMLPMPASCCASIVTASYDA
jgi:hypothetical protein